MKNKGEIYMKKLKKVLKIILIIMTFLESIYFAYAFYDERKASDAALGFMTITICCSCLFFLLRG